MAKTELKLVKVSLQTFVLVDFGTTDGRRDPLKPGVPGLKLVIILAEKLLYVWFNAIRGPAGRVDACRLSRAAATAWLSDFSAATGLNLLCRVHPAETAFLR